MSLKPMGQLQRGVTHILEAQVHPLTVDIPRFIQLSVLLSLLKPMAAIGFKGSKGM
jgi:hypothetical protein